MLRFAALVLVAVELGGGFGDATATVISTTSESMQVELHVEVTIPADAVLAHLALPGEPNLTLPMLEREDGVYGITTELKKANYQVIFEILGPTSTQSQPVTLGGIGAEIPDDGTASTDSTEASDISPATSGWIWLAVAFGAASLSLLAFWVLSGRDDSDEDLDHTSVDSDETSEDSALS